MQRRKLLGVWWNRWRGEYLTNLRLFNSPGRESRPIRVGEVVLVHDANQKRLLWPIAIVTETIPGRDGRIRFAVLRTSSGLTINRPIQRLFPLEVQQHPASIEADVLPEPDQQLEQQQPAGSSEPPTNHLSQQVADQTPADSQQAEELTSPDRTPPSAGPAAAPQCVGTLQQPTPQIRTTRYGRAVRRPQSLRDFV